MRREWRWAIAALMGLAVGTVGSEAYARMAAPFYFTAARVIGSLQPWDIEAVEVRPGKSTPGAELRLVGTVRRHSSDEHPAATVVGRVQVGESVETPVVFWTLVLAWGARSKREHLVRIALAVPLFLMLESLTTVYQLTYGLADASAVLAGDQSPLTLWDRWSRILEAGGRFTLEVAAALLSVWAAARLLSTGGTPKGVLPADDTNQDQGK
jgi:hypothetical protein